VALAHGHCGAARGCGRAVPGRRAERPAQASSDAAHCGAQHLGHVALNLRACAQSVHCIQTCTAAEAAFLSHSLRFWYQYYR
jgi:hypothetical protein